MYSPESLGKTSVTTTTPFSLYFHQQNKYRNIIWLAHTWTSLFSDNEMTLREMFLPQKIHFTYKDSVITNRTRDWDPVCLSPVEFPSTLTYWWLFLLYIIVVFRLQKSIKHVKRRQVPTYLSQPISSIQQFTCRFTYKTVQLFRLQ